MHTGAINVSAAVLDFIAILREGKCCNKVYTHGDSAAVKVETVVGCRRL